MTLTYKGKTVVIDSEYQFLLRRHSWHFKPHRNTTYLVSDIGGKRVYFHRIVMNAQKGRIVDHINCDGLDNRRSNLRLASPAQNARNAVRSKANTSGYKGVSFDSERGKWTAKICRAYKTINLGRFDSAVEAAKAYNTAALKYFGAYANINQEAA